MSLTSLKSLLEWFEAAFPMELIPAGRTRVGEKLHTTKYLPFQDVGVFPCCFTPWDRSFLLPHPCAAPSPAPLGRCFEPLHLVPPWPPPRLNLAVLGSSGGVWTPLMVPSGSTCRAGGLENGGQPRCLLLSVPTICSSTCVFL